MRKKSIPVRNAWHKKKKKKRKLSSKALRGSMADLTHTFTYPDVPASFSTTVTGSSFYKPIHHGTTTDVTYTDDDTKPSTPLPENPAAKQTFSYVHKDLYWMLSNHYHVGDNPNKSDHHRPIPDAKPYTDPNDLEDDDDDDADDPESDDEDPDDDATNKDNDEDWYALPFLDRFPTQEQLDRYTGYKKKPMPTTVLYSAVDEDGETTWTEGQTYNDRFDNTPATLQTVTTTTTTQTNVTSAEQREKDAYQLYLKEKEAIYANDAKSKSLLNGLID